MEDLKKVPDTFSPCKPIYQYTNDVKIVIESIIGLLEANIQVKHETIKNIKNKNVVATIMSANDEDRLSLVTEWHGNRFKTLFEERQKISDYIESLKTK